MSLERKFLAKRRTLPRNDMERIENESGMSESGGGKERRGWHSRASRRKRGKMVSPGARESRKFRIKMDHDFVINDTDRYRSGFLFIVPFKNTILVRTPPLRRQIMITR